MELEFHGMGKIPRLHRDVVITEKIDGTNAQVCIGWNDIEFPEPTPCLVVGDYVVKAGSRTRWLTPTDDNHGFARWVWDNAEELVAGLGVGRHFGEWWGKGINRGYGLTEKRFSLFNTERWDDTNTPAICHTVPVILRGNGITLNTDVGLALRDLMANGSWAAPGFGNPEGVVIFHVAGNHLYKVTLENDDVPKALVKEKGKQASAPVEESIAVELLPPLGVAQFKTELGELVGA